MLLELEPHVLIAELSHFRWQVLAVVLEDLVVEEDGFSLELEELFHLVWLKIIRGIGWVGGLK